MGPSEHGTVCDHTSSPTRKVVQTKAHSVPHSACFSFATREWTTCLLRVWKGDNRQANRHKDADPRNEVQANPRIFPCYTSLPFPVILENSKHPGFSRHYEEVTTFHSFIIIPLYSHDLCLTVSYFFQNFDTISYLVLSPLSFCFSFCAYISVLLIVLWGHIK